MGSAAEINEPTTGAEKHQPVKVEDGEEEDEQVFELERKTSSFRHGKRPYSADSSTITTITSSSSSFSGDGTDLIPDFVNGEGEHIGIDNLEVSESPEQETGIGFHEEKETGIGFHEEHEDGNNDNVYFDGEQGSRFREGESRD